MSSVMLSKLTPPPLREGHVVRERLLALADERLPKRVTLIAAPAGFGKTTLAREIVLRWSRPCVWLSLAATENDPQRLASYVVHGLETVAVELAESLRPLLALAPFPAELFWQQLSNGLAQRQRPFLLVLDDYHTLSQPRIDALVAAFVETLPQTCHLLLTSRTLPALPLARWRGKGWLNEIGQAALRFELEEARDFLADCMDLALPQRLVEALELRTEGWVTGLQLAALSLQQRPDHTAFMSGFSGSHRFVLDYLMDEVVAHQPPEVVEFMLATAVLERFNAPLAAALLGEPPAASESWGTILHYLEHHHLFLIPLDSQRNWYRYHHLFGDMLRSRLIAQQGAEAPATYRLRAARWCLAHGLPEEGIEYGLAAQAFEETADWISQEADRMWTRGETHTFQRWLSQLPESVLAAHPQAAIYLAWGHFFDGQMVGDAAFHWQRADELLQQAEVTLAGQSETSPQELGRLFAAQTALASVRHDMAGTVERGERARQLLAGEPSLWHSVALISLAFVYRMQQRPQSALALFEEGCHMAQTCGNFSGAIFARDQWGSLLLERGLAAEAEAVYRAGLAYVERLGAAKLPIVGQLYCGLGRLELANGRLAAGRSWLTKGIELLEQGGFDVAEMGELLRTLSADAAGVERTALVEPLSPRELEILAGLAQGLSNREIGEQLFIATGTVKSHTSSIYGKLGVRDRMQAVLKAQELDLI